MSEKVPYRVLLADDEHYLLQTIAYVLKKEGYDVYKAYDGLEAVSMAGQINPDVIILDYKMPQLDGWNAAKRIREIESCRLTPIIGYTAYADEQSRNDGFAKGLNEILLKPLDMHELKEIIADYIARSSLEAE